MSENIKDATQEVVNNYTVMNEEDFIKFDVTTKEMIMSKDDEKSAKLFEAYSQYLGKVRQPKTTKEGYYKNKYAPYDEVLRTIYPVLSEYGLAIITTPFSHGEYVGIIGILTHKDGGYVKFPTLFIKPDKKDAQGIGGAITYGRRYLESAIAGVASEEDDDGNLASGIDSTKPNSSKKPSTPKKKETKKEVDPKVKKAQDDLSKVVKEKIAEFDQETVVEIIKDLNNGVANYSKNTNVSELNKIRETLSKMTKEAK